MKRLIPYTLLVFALLAGALRADEGRWRSVSRRQSDGLRGNPLTDALRFSSEERPLFADARDGRFDEHSLIEAALIACGDDPAAQDRYRQQFAKACTALQLAADQSSDAAEQIERVHHTLHQQFLYGGYDANATDLAKTFDTGVYNCASATLLFVALAEQLHLNVHAVELPGHVRAIIDLGNRQCEIEPTCPSWTGAVQWETTRSEAEASRKVSPLGLIAMIYYNRGVDAFYRQNFEAAIVANRKALLLDPDSVVARGNLLAAVNNWALALAADSQFREAISLLADGVQFAPDHLPFQHNAEHIRRLRDQASASPAATVKPLSATSF